MLGLDELFNRPFTRRHELSRLVVENDEAQVQMGILAPVLVALVEELDVEKRRLEHDEMKRLDLASRRGREYATVSLLEPVETRFAYVYRGKVLHKVCERHPKDSFVFHTYY